MILMGMGFVVIVLVSALLLSHLQHRSSVAALQKRCDELRDQKETTKSALDRARKAYEQLASRLYKDLLTYSETLDQLVSAKRKFAEFRRDVRKGLDDLSGRGFKNKNGVFLDRYQPYLDLGLLVWGADRKGQNGQNKKGK